MSVRASFRLSVLLEQTAVAPTEIAVLQTRVRDRTDVIADHTDERALLPPLRVSQ